MATVSQLYGSATTFSTTNLASLNGLGTGATGTAWQSALVTNLTSLAIDYEIALLLATTNTAPAGDKAVYVFISPNYYTGTGWVTSTLGTVSTLATTDTTCAILSPSELRPAVVLNYTTQAQPLSTSFFLSNVVGQTMPDGFTLVVLNNSGAGLAASGNSALYRTIQQNIA